MTMKLKITNEDQIRTATIARSDANVPPSLLKPGESQEIYIHSGCSLRIEEVQELAAPPATDHIMQFFAYAHLPAHLQEVSRPFALLAEQLVGPFGVPRNPERTVALRKLLEAKDAAVRAKLAKDPT